MHRHKTLPDWKWCSYNHANKVTRGQQRPSSKLSASYCMLGFACCLIAVSSLGRIKLANGKLVEHVEASFHKLIKSFAQVLKSIVSVKFALAKDIL